MAQRSAPGRFSLQLDFGYRAAGLDSGDPEIAYLSPR
jgi:hypothetical protein